MDHPDQRYSIAEVSDMTDVAPHVLRQWEARYPQLKPKRNRANRRQYSARDIEIVRRMKELTRHQHLKTRGASQRLSQDLYGQGRPETNTEARKILDELEREVRAALRVLDNLSGDA